MSETIRRLRPTPSDAYLGNPHKGCCTFQRFNGDSLFPGITWSEEGPVDFPGGSKEEVEGYLPSTVAYCRWFWSVLEPERGKYDFSMIGRALEICAQRGQTLAVRLMAFGSMRQPQIPEWYSSAFPMGEFPTRLGMQRVPRHDAPEFLEHWGNVVQEFARRYDGHPLLETVDVAFLGPWGEGAGECTAETCGKFADLFKKAFLKTPRLALVDGEQFKIGIDSGAGWRCDCFGDLCVSGSSPPGTSTVPSHLVWNHTFDAYPFSVVQAGARDVWRTAPVHLETCGVPLGWQQRNFDIDFILQEGLKMHATYFMPKSTRLPSQWMDKIAGFCRSLGYRYIYRQAQHETVISRDQPFVFRSWIENVGVAPIYRRYDFALRFRQDDLEKLVVLKDVNILDWLPGDACIDTLVRPPAGLRVGPADLSVGLVAPGTSEAKIRFAIKEAYPDRWVPLCPIYIQ